MGIRFYLTHDKHLTECYVGKAGGAYLFDPMDIFKAEDVYGKKRVTSEHIKYLLHTDFKYDVMDFLTIVNGITKCGGCGNTQVHGKCSYCGWRPAYDVPDDLWVEWG